VHDMRPDLVISCGDLPFDYLEYVVTVAQVPLLYVPGNHDPDVGGRPLQADVTAIFKSGYARAWDETPRGPEGCTNVDGRVIDESGVRVCGLGGSPRYTDGPNQYSQAEMRRRGRRITTWARLRQPFRERAVDVFVAHTPPRGLGDDDDPAHRGFDAFHRLVRILNPKVMVHGHVHPHGPALPDRLLGGTDVVNAVGHRLLEI
jgi:hypothetical protein